MNTDKQIFVSPIAPISFACITGKGVDNHDATGKLFTVSLVVDKKQKKKILADLLIFWEANKSPKQGSKPDNYENLVYTFEESDEMVFTGKTNRDIGDEVVKIGLKDGQGNVLDPKVFGAIGKGSEGRISVTLKMYSDGGKRPKEGISIFLNALQLTKFVRYEGSGDGSEAFDEIDGSEALLPDDGFKEKKKKKSKKKDK